MNKIMLRECVGSTVSKRLCVKGETSREKLYLRIVIEDDFECDDRCRESDTHYFGQ